MNSKRHSRIANLTLLVVFLSLLIGCQKKDDRLIEFKGRKIDLQPYVEAFPYKEFKPFYDANKMFYFRQGKTTQLLEIDLESTDSEVLDLENGRVVSNIDFSKRNVWTTRYRKSDGNLYWVGDQRNDEVLNIFKFDPETDSLEKLTDVPYIFGWRWNPDETKVAYVARLGAKENRLGELRILDLETGEEKKIIQDTPEMRFIWGNPSWQPNGAGVVLTAVANADRTYGNLVYVPLEDTPDTPILLTDAKQPRYFPAALKTWLNENEFLLLSNESGYANVYKYNIRTRQQTPVTLYQEDIKQARVLEMETGEKRLLANIYHPIESKVLLLDPATGKLFQEKIFSKNLNFLDQKDNKILMQATSAVSPFQIDEVIASDSELASKERIGLPKALQENLVQAEVERVEFPTFDIDPATGKQRMLHGFLYHPTNPLPREEQMVMIKAFYGGRNSYNEQIHILCEAGIYVFSPAPRGSAGFGREFAALNDKDLGGNEIIDIIYAGKYISKRLDIPPERIGPFGGSHGGYATMRLLTFPGEINGHEAQFDWGFGISSAGFSDIIAFYEMSNIPDWVTLEAGDPRIEADKLRDRSPITHADELEGRLLLLHGENDSRVPVVESRTMAIKLEELGKPVTYVEFPEQGHRVKGLENTVRVYRAWFDFLSKVGR
ncbi:S9 family peptidase [candidate division KSB1 bacterium]|nr:S9 family peptidase [candidate division KSB1 bacterium]NIR69540.1 S9 family peptidase [candidate division KSB1 bacterium]NIS22850.1 S9 family peptidase [candidate division KSB1 bacterium]NIT69686.1 S9 family peptidase [candidate division KSB1 bacterium]NIU23356.1 S9 family peptidase [candidate division KSB1 bacterium]